MNSIRESLIEWKNEASGYTRCDFLKMENWETLRETIACLQFKIIQSASHLKLNVFTLDVEYVRTGDGSGMFKMSPGFWTFGVAFLS